MRGDWTRFEQATRISRRMTSGNCIDRIVLSNHRGCKLCSTITWNIPRASDKHSPIELRPVADTVIRRRLVSVPGVSQVTPLGGDVKPHQILLSPEKLLAHNLTLGQVIKALPRGEPKYFSSASVIGDTAIRSF